MAGKYVHPGQKGGSYTPSRGKFAGHTYSSYKAYQNANARAKGFKSAGTRLASPRKIAPSDIAGLNSPSRLRALDALNRIRDVTKKVDIQTAARESHTTVANVKRYAGQALKKGARGRYEATKSDTLAAVMNLTTDGGTVAVPIRGSRDRVLVAKYENAVGRFINFGDESALAPFRGKSVRLPTGERIPLLTDPDRLTQLGREGRLGFDNLYVKAAA